jgi:hypothetical protein
MATHVTLPEGLVVATTSRLAEGVDALRLLEPTTCRTVLGEVGLYRVERAGAVPVYGPDDDAELAMVLRRLEETSGGLALVDGAWERRGFAAPDVTDGTVLAVGAAYAGGPERAAAAVRYVAELLDLPVCEAPAAQAWREAVASGQAFALDREGRTLGGPILLRGTSPGLVEEFADRVGSFVLPAGLHDEFLAPLIRAGFGFDIVVRDPTLVRAAPVYLAAWAKGGGAVRVVQPMRLLSVATNPRTSAGPDADPEQFRQLVKQALPDIPVHDVRLESAGPG